MASSTTSTQACSIRPNSRHERLATRIDSPKSVLAPRTQKYSGRVGTPRPPLIAYLGKEIPATVDEVRGHLWNDSIRAGEDRDQAGSAKTVLEQYSTCVEMADRVSAVASECQHLLPDAQHCCVHRDRRDRGPAPENQQGVLGVPARRAFLRVRARYWLLRSYRQLKSAKYAVIGAMEERLPASPFWSAEWSALGQGRDPRRYWPLTHIERWVPDPFAAAYVGAFIAAVAS